MHFNGTNILQLHDFWARYLTSLSLWFCTHLRDINKYLVESIKWNHTERANGLHSRSSINVNSLPSVWKVSIDSRTMNDLTFQVKSFWLLIFFFWLLILWLSFPDCFFFLLRNFILVFSLLFKRHGFDSCLFSSIPKQLEGFKSLTVGSWENDKKRATLSALEVSFSWGEILSQLQSFISALLFGKAARSSLLWNTVKKTWLLVNRVLFVEKWSASQEEEAAGKDKRELDGDGGVEGMADWSIC